MPELTPETSSTGCEKKKKELECWSWLGAALGFNHCCGKDGLFTIVVATQVKTLRFEPTGTKFS
jgi:hypothetical protein